MISLFDIQSICLSSFVCFAFNRSSSLALGSSFVNNSISSSFVIDLLYEGDFSLGFFWRAHSASYLERYFYCQKSQLP